MADGLESLVPRKHRQSFRGAVRSPLTLPSQIVEWVSAAQPTTTAVRDGGLRCADPPYKPIMISLLFILSILFILSNFPSV